MTRAFWLAGLGVAVVLATLPAFASVYAVSLTLSILMYAGLALSWSIFTGPTRYVSLATSAFFGLGAYTSALLVGVVPWLAVIAIAALGAVLLALLLGLAVLHLRGIYFAILTFGVSELLMNAITYVEQNAFGTVGRIITAAPALTTVYWSMLGITVLAALSFRLVATSGLGAALRAVGCDEGRAATLGLNVRNAKLTGFCFSALFAGAIGAAMAVRWTYIDPRVVFSPAIVFQTVLIAMIGGPTKLLGPILGAVVFGLLQEWLRLSFSYGYMVLLGILLVLAVMFVPDGLASVIHLPEWRRQRTHADKASHV
jgi:branched-chain amino acid transport system permease protein